MGLYRKFREIETMTQNKESTFFIQPSYENLMKKAFLSWEKERDDETQKLHAQEVTALKERLRLTESNLKKEMDTLRQLMLDTVIQLKKDKSSQEQDQQGASSAHEDLLFKEYEVCSETTLRNMISSIIDDFTKHENKLKEQLDTCRNVCSSIVDDYIRREMKTDNDKLQRELEELKLKEREWEQKLREAEDRETLAFKRLETELSRREKELESEERGTTKTEQDLQPSGEERDPHSKLSEEKCRSLGEGERDLKTEDEDSLDSGSSDFEGSKPVRRNSNEYSHPNMTGRDPGPLNTL